MSFRSWNNHRLAIGKTKRLKYEHLYDEMQEKLNDILRELNHFIAETNTMNGVVSPFLHSYIHKSSKKKTRYIYSRLADGLHPSEDLGAVWAQHMFYFKEKMNSI